MIIIVLLRYYLVYIKLMKGKGKCMIASRDISALELILFDTAVG